MALSAKGKPLSLDAAVIKRPKLTAIQKKETDESMEMDHAETPENVTDSCETKVKKGNDLEDNSKNQPKDIYKDNGIASNKEKHSMQGYQGEISRMLS